MTTLIQDKIAIQDPTKSDLFKGETLRIINQSVNPQIHPNGKTCLTCKKPLGWLKSASESLGTFAVVPSECEECRAKSYQQHLVEEQQQEFARAYGKCGGYQNKPTMFHGKVVVWEDIKDFDFQKELIDLIPKIIDDEFKQGLFVFGATGTGKTFLSKLLHNELIKRCKHTCFIKAVDLAIVLRRAAMTPDRYSHGDILAEFRKVGTLIVDDYGTQKNTEFVKEAIFSIFDYRYDNRKRTILTTNLRLDLLREDDPRLSSRLQDENWVRPIEFRGADIRTWENLK